MTQKATILIVDDDNTYRKTLALQVKSRGYEVLAAGSGSEALFQLRGNLVDLILLDLNMPGMSGNEVLQKIRADYSALELPVLMLTSSDETDDMIKALGNGANDYLIKSTNIEILAARIETQLSLKSMNTALKVKQSDLRQEYVQTRSKLELDRISMKKEIDHRVAAEIAMIESEKRYKVLYDNTPAMYFSLNIMGEIQSVNRYGARVLGYQRNELIGRDISELYAPGDRERFQEYLAEATLHPDSSYRWQLHKQTREGMPILIRETAKLVYGLTREKNILLVGVDISDEHIDLGI
jgi:PAS domain S-box-containing protein